MGKDRPRDVTDARHTQAVYMILEKRERIQKAKKNALTKIAKVKAARKAVPLKKRKK